LATSEFERVGTWLEAMNWQQYVDFLTQWAAASMGLRYDPAAGLRAARHGLPRDRGTPCPPGGVAVVNSLSVYEFTDGGKIRHLDVYLQQPR